MDHTHVCVCKEHECLCVPQSGHEELSVYELERLENIRQNQAFLSSIHLFQVHTQELDAKCLCLNIHENESSSDISWKIFSTIFMYELCTFINISNINQLFTFSFLVYCLT